MTYSIKYREKGYAFEAKHAYYYLCFVCGRPILSESGSGTIHRKGQPAINVLVNGQVKTIHLGCNRTYEQGDHYAISHT